MICFFTKKVELKDRIVNKIPQKDILLEIFSYVLYAFPIPLSLLFFRHSKHG